ncbi:hypothetical protein C457_09614, partial [Haloferax prahovense DSM 18310]
MNHVGESRLAVVRRDAPERLEDGVVEDVNARVDEVALAVDGVFVDVGDTAVVLCLLYTSLS